MRVWCAISAHGFGHAAQVVPILNELGKRFPKLHVILRTAVPESFFRQRLNVAWELSRAQQDIGCIQRGPLSIDVEETWTAHEQFHQEWNERVRHEIADMGRYAPRLVVSNISYLAVEAGADSGLPTIAIASLSWDQILKGLDSRGEASRAQVIDHIRTAYGKADVLIRLSPGMMMDAFPRIHNVGPVVQPLQKSDRVGQLVRNGDNRPIVLVGFGGVPLHTLPLEALGTMNKFRFLVDGEIASTYENIISISSLPVTFPDLLPVVDMIVSKPGYGICVEAVQGGLPFIYVCRFNFAEEPFLIDYVRRYGRAVELSRQAFFAGAWEDALLKAWDMPVSRERPPLNGVADAVHVMTSYLA